MFSTKVVDRAAGWLERRTSRRTFLRRVAVVGSALTVSGFDYVLRPGTAYASVCGGGSSCASGWTAMCCTVNNGVNQCPPGSFAAGWWKADGASLCGGHARYYIDCNSACACGCGSGARFCSSGCWNCHAHCADNGSCDHRRVCWNVFRYGQCHQEISCSGPVWCRVISCTPPWQWESCSSASATDDFTTSHNAPCLPHHWSAMQHKYAAIGSLGSPLGASKGPEHDAHVGTMEKFVNGRMYHSHGAGAHYTLGDIATKYHKLGESASKLGMPVTDTHVSADGAKHNVFQHGSIYSKHSTGTHVVLGAIDAEYARLNRAAGWLGLPTTDTRHTADGVGRHNEFQGGAIYSHPRLGTHGMPTSVLDLWDLHRREQGPLGYPVGDYHDISGTPGRKVEFQHGVIDVHPDYGARGVWGHIFRTWSKDYGRERGQLGFPTSTVRHVDAIHTVCDFEHGTLVYDETTGQVTKV